MLNIFEEGIVKVYRSYYIYFNKTVRQKCKRRTKPIQSLSQIPISDYDIQVCLWLKQYSVLFLFFHVIFSKKSSEVGLCILYFDANIQYLAIRVMKLIIDVFILFSSKIPKLIL